MLVSHILAIKGRDVVTIAPERTLADAARALAEHKIGALVVVGGKDIAGVLSERDVVAALAGDGVAALSRTIKSYMTTAIETCTEGDSIEALMEVMTNGRFRHVPVVKDGVLAGIVSIGDVVKSRIEDAEHEARALKDYIRAG